MELRRLVRLCSVVLGLAAIVGCFMLLYAASIHAFSADSDGATVVLEGFSMGHGQGFLGHWALSLDSFWLVDALWYLAGTAIAGITAALEYAIPAAIGVAVVVVGVVLAAKGRRGAGLAVSAAVVIAVLALPSHALAYFFLRGPLHVGTALWCLVAFLALRRPRFGWGFVVAIVFLAAGMLGDLQALALGVVPVACAGLSTMLRRRRVQDGLPLVVAAAAAVVLDLVVRKITVAIGTFSMHAANPTAGFHQMLRNLKHGFHEGVIMMGVGGSYYGLGGEPTALSWIHVVEVVVVLGAVAWAIVSLVIGVFAGRITLAGARASGGAHARAEHSDDEKEQEERSPEVPYVVDDMLTFATVASPVAFTVLAIAADTEYARYLTAGIIFGAILAGRVVGRVAERIHSVPTGALLATLGLAAAGCFFAGTVVEVNQPVPVDSAATLASFLEHHGLHEGIGAYWSASVTTVASKGKVEIRPVVAHGTDVVRYQANSTSLWYADQHFRFLVYQPGAPWGGVSTASATDTFGKPGASYVVGSYEVLVWPHPITVAAHGSRF